MKILEAAIFFYLIGSFIFLIKADFRINAAFWDPLYWLWFRGKDVLFFGAIIDLMPKGYRWLMRPLFIYSIILLLWEIVDMSTNLGVNNPLMVTIAFTILVLIVIVLFIKDLREKWKGN